MKMNFIENQEFWEEFIAIYKKNPCLWNVKTKEYTNHHKKNVAYEELVKKTREVKPDADRNYVVKKINSLRSSFRRQLRKIKDSRESGTNEVFEPTLWYFDLLLFTLDQEDDANQEILSASQQNLEETIDVKEEIDYNIFINPESPTHSQSTTVNQRGRKRKTAPEESQSGSSKRIELPVLSRSSNQGNEEPEDEWTIFGKSVELQLRGLGKEQVIIAQKLISDVLFHAKLGNLACGSAIQIKPQRNY